MTKHIIDRRLNPKGKSLSNRQRFIRRAKKHLAERVKKHVVERSITDTSSEDISIPNDDIKEPQFQTDSTSGNYDFVLPGNKEFVVGDKIEKPQGGAGGGGAGPAGDDGSGEDDFEFTLSREEYLNIVFEDLELPNLEEKNKEDVIVWESKRAGYTTSGNPSQLNLEQTMIRSLGRRIALKFPKLRQIKELEEEKEELLEFVKNLSDSKQKRTKEGARLMEVLKELAELKRKSRAVSFVDPIDLRFNTFTKHPKPTTTAVMVCIMDVSASMQEREKELSKRFFLLLYLFLERKYERVDVVFIRHHTEAKECSEEEFFHSKETGGTLVSTGLNLAFDIIRSRYPSHEWNAYVAQASDGDNFQTDMPALQDVMTNKLLPLVKYFVYVEISGMASPAHTFWGSAAQTGGKSGMWSLYESLGKQDSKLVVKQVKDKDGIIPVFRELFSGKNSNVIAKAE